MLIFGSLMEVVNEEGRIDGYNKRIGQRSVENGGRSGENGWSGGAGADDKLDRGKYSNSRIVFL